MVSWKLNEESFESGVRDQKKAINIEYLDFSKACGKVSKKIPSTRKTHKLDGKKVK